MSWPELIPQTVYQDHRGSFQELYVEGKYPWIEGPVGQVNLVKSHRGVARGLHVNTLGTQWKAVYSLVGHHWSVAVDVRKTSLTKGRWVGMHLNEGSHGFFIPPGFALGLLCLTEAGVSQYMTNVKYDPENEKSLSVFSDVNVQWPMPRDEMIVSDRDLLSQKLEYFMSWIS